VSGAATDLPTIVECIEKLEAHRKNVGADIRQAYSEAESKGFNVKALRRIVRERKVDSAEQAEIEACHGGLPPTAGNGRGICP
jgi:uncharacterized protein (UPF0335 family)